MPLRKEFTSVSLTSSFAVYQPLMTACSTLQEVIVAACLALGLTPAVIGWPTMANGRPEGMQEIRDIHGWLVSNDLIDEPVEEVEGIGQSSQLQGAVFSCPFV